MSGTDSRGCNCLSIEPGMVSATGIFLVESVDEPDNWYLGDRDADGVIVCWE